MWKYLFQCAVRHFRSNKKKITEPYAGPISNISKIWYTPLPEKSKWIFPCQVHYIENGEAKSRDIIKISDGVSIILFNVTRKKLIYVRQFRAAVYYGMVSGSSTDIPKGNIDLVKYPPEMAITLEQCAGLVDKKKSLEQIAREEVLEECGYDVPAESMQLVYTYRSGVGASSSAQTFFYCEVCDAQRVSGGGGVHDEVIQVVELSIDEARQLVKTGACVSTGPSTLLGTLWFITNKT